MQTESSCSDAVCSSFFFFFLNGGKYKQTNFSSLKFNMEHGVTAWFTLLPLHTCMRENVLWWKMEELWLLLVYDSGYQCCMLSATVTSPPTPKGLNLSLWALLTSKMSESCQGEVMAHARSFLSNYIVRHIYAADTLSVFVSLRHVTANHVTLTCLSVPVWTCDNHGTSE